MQPLRPAAKPLEIEINDRRGKKRQHLADDQASDDGDSKRAAQLGARARAEGQRQGAKKAAIVVMVIGRKRSRQAS